VVEAEGIPDQQMMRLEGERAHSSVGSMNMPFSSRLMLRHVYRLDRLNHGLQSGGVDMAFDALVFQGHHALSALVMACLLLVLRTGICILGDTQPESRGTPC
jgi:hypothetical protein